MQRVVSRGGDLSPETAVPPPPHAPSTVRGLKPPSSSRFPAPEVGASPEGQWGAPGGLRGCGLPRSPSFPGTRTAASPPQARPERGAPQRRSPRSSRRPDGARRALHVQERRGALGAPRATAASGRAPRGAPRLTSRADSSAGSRGSRTCTPALGDQLPAGCPFPTPRPVGAAPRASSGPAFYSQLRTRLQPDQ